MLTFGPKVSNGALFVTQPPDHNIVISSQDQPPKSIFAIVNKETSSEISTKLSSMQKTTQFYFKTLEDKQLKAKVDKENDLYIWRVTSEDDKDQGSLELKTLLLLDNYGLITHSESSFLGNSREKMGFVPIMRFIPDTDLSYFFNRMLSVYDGRRHKFTTRWLVIPQIEQSSDALNSKSEIINDPSSTTNLNSILQDASPVLEHNESLVSLDSNDTTLTSEAAGLTEVGPDSEQVLENPVHYRRPRGKSFAALQGPLVEDTNPIYVHVIIDAFLVKSSLVCIIEPKNYNTALKHLYPNRQIVVPSHIRQMITAASGAVNAKFGFLYEIVNSQLSLIFVNDFHCRNISDMSLTIGQL